MTELREARRAVMTRECLGSIGFGGAPIGNLYRPIDDEAASDTIDAALTAGIRWFDTAPYYGFGLSERRLGDARVGNRMIISTKVGRSLDQNHSVRDDAERHGFHSAEPWSPRFDYSGSAMTRSIEESCRRLRIDRIDIAFIHDIGAATHGARNDDHMAQLMGSGLAALARLRDDGVIGAIGVGVNDTAAAADMIDTGMMDVVLLAGRYTLLEHAASASFLARCAAEDVALVLGGPFNSGILAGSQGRYNYAEPPPAITARVTALRKIASSFNVPLAAAALQFCAAHPAVVSVVAGFGSAWEVDEAAANMVRTIPTDFWNALLDKGLIDPGIPVPRAVSA